MKICIFERLNEKYRFSKNKIYFHKKKNTPQLLGHIVLQNMKVGEKTNFGRLATLFQIFWMLTFCNILQTNDSRAYSARSVDPKLYEIVVTH